jgi:aminoglycoside/choline kinase family phosphotransferase
LNANETEILAKAKELSKDMPDGAFDAAAELHLITGGGSDRSFYRVTAGDRTAVLLIDSPAELERYLLICNFLRDSGVATPQCYAIDEKAGAFLMEDLGSLRLDEALAETEPDEELSLYHKCIDILVTMETVATDRMLENGLLADMRFDRRSLLAETDYFRDEFLGRYCPVAVDRGWDKERSVIADLLADQTPVFMHRDFQSRNLIVKEGQIRVIDFQNAHRGPGLYDAASLLKDPYHPIPKNTRYSLLDELHGRLKDRGCPIEDDFERYTHSFVLAGIQRNLQALAAYVRLGIVKGKSEFLESIPPALDLLEEGIAEAGGFPSMRRMVEAIRERSEKG